jgi:hypothetical protein
MSALEELIERCKAVDIRGWRKAATELAALLERVRVLEDGLLISGNLLTDVKNFIEVEVKICRGVGMEYEIGLLDCIDAFQDLHGETVKELGEKHEKVKP